MASSQFAADDGRGAGLMSFFGGGVDSAPRPVSYEPVSQANSKAGLSSASSASAASWGQATFPNPEAEDVSVRGFLRWMTTMQNKASAWWERLQAEERHEFKMNEDRKYAEYKASLKAKVTREFEHAKEEHEHVTDINLDKGAECKAEVEEMRRRRHEDEEEYRQAGREIIALYGAHQVERAKLAVAETHEEHAVLGRAVRVESKLLRKAITTERDLDVENKRQLVEMQKADDRSVYRTAVDYTL